MLVNGIVLMLSAMVPQFGPLAAPCSNPPLANSSEERWFSAAMPSQLGDVALMRGAFVNKPDNKKLRGYYQLLDHLEQCVWQDYNLGFRSSRQPNILVVGANNGVFASRFYASVLAGEWGGLLIESDPCAFEQLVGNYRKKHHGAIWPGIYFRNIFICADTPAGTSISKASGQQPSSLSAQLPSWFVPEKASSAATAVSEGSQRSSAVGLVPSETLGSALSGVPIHQYDMVEIDVDGADEEVLVQIHQHYPEKNFELLQLPRVICVDVCTEACTGWFLRRNYSIARVLGQYCGYRRDLVFRV